MIFKLVILAVIIYGVYILFFKNANLPQRREQKFQSDKNEDIDTVVECNECGIYISLDEAIVKDGFYFCSKKCAKIK